VEVLFVREHVNNLTKPILIAVLVNLDVNVLLDMSVMKLVTVFHGANVPHKTHVALMSIIPIVAAHVPNQNAHVFKHMAIIAILKDFRLYVR
jgi:hypothetical protein